VIFATVGSQEPFDRLIRAVDEWAALHARSDVFAQIGESTYCPEHIKFTKFLEPSEFSRMIHEASVVVAHAGMGSIISALEIGKPIVVMPRRGALRETRNDHQVATAERFGARSSVIVAQGEQELAEKLDYALTLGAMDRVNAEASPRLIGTIRAFLDGELDQQESLISLGKLEPHAPTSAPASLAAFRARKA
jgi:UDP-N-acetylglucosamine transferase subunit ALG13